MRLYFLDNLRYFTIVNVVLFHIIYMYNGQNIPAVIGAFYENQIQDIFQYFVYPWIMVLLYIISGISADLYLKKYNNFLYDRTIKLLVPSTIGVVVFGWIQGYYSFLINDVDAKMPKDINIIIYFGIMCLCGIGVLWFNHILWVCSILLIFVRKYEKTAVYKFFNNIKINPLSIVLLGLGLFLSAKILNGPVVLYRFGIYIYAFFIGYFVLSKENNIIYLEMNYIYLLIISLIFGFSFVYKYNGLNYSSNEIFGSILSMGYSWFSCLTLLGIGKKLFDNEYKFTIFMRKKSYGIYVFHYIILSAVGYYLRKYSNFCPLIQYILVGFSCFFGSILLFEIISKIPILRWCVLGIIIIYQLKELII